MACHLFVVILRFNQIPKPRNHQPFIFKLRGQGVHLIRLASRQILKGSDTICGNDLCTKLETRESKQEETITLEKLGFTLKDGQVHLPPHRWKSMRSCMFNKFLKSPLSPKASPNYYEARSRSFHQDFSDEIFRAQMFFLGNWKCMDLDFDFLFKDHTLSNINEDLGGLIDTFD